MIIALFLCFPAYVIAQIIAIVHLRHGWLWASLVPVIPMIIVVVLTVQALLHQSNLWPVLLLFASPPALVFILVIIVLFAFHRRFQRNTHNPS